METNTGKCFFMEHNISWGGDCYCCGKCGEVFISKTECEKQKEGLYRTGYADGFTGVEREDEPN